MCSLHCTAHCTPAYLVLHGHGHCFPVRYSDPTNADGQSLLPSQPLHRYVQMKLTHATQQSLACAVAGSSQHKSTPGQRAQCLPPRKTTAMRTCSARLLSQLAVVHTSFLILNHSQARILTHQQVHSHSNSHQNSHRRQPQKAGSHRGGKGTQ